LERKGTHKTEINKFICGSSYLQLVTLIVILQVIVVFAPRIVVYAHMFMIAAKRIIAVYLAIISAASTQQQ
jgi:hypothetical protein